MIDAKLIAKMLEVDHVYSGTQFLKDQDGNKLEEFNITAFWAASIDYFRPESLDELTIAVIHTEKWTRGILLVPPIQEPFDREFAGQQPIKPLTIYNWDDPVLDTITNMDLIPIPEPRSIGLFSPIRYSFSFQVSILGASGNLFFADHLMGRYRQRFHYLFQSLIETTWYMIERYDDEELRQFATEELKYPKLFREPFFDTKIRRFFKRWFRQKHWWEREREKALAATSNIDQNEE